MKAAKSIVCGMVTVAAFLVLQSSGAGAETKEYYIGTWEVSYTNGLTVFFQLNANGTAVKTVKNVAGRVTGTWKLNPDGALITWADGWRDLIKPDKTNAAYAPGASLNNPPFNTGSANKTKKSDAVGSKRHDDRGDSGNQIYGPNDNYRNPIPPQ